MEMLKFIVTHTYTRIGDKFYLQTRGLGTGSHTSGAYSEIIVDHTYNTVISTFHIKPLLLSTYVDDAWLIWPDNTDAFIKFKEALNNIWPTINFTHEYSTNHKLNFLDLTTTFKNGKITYEFLQKST